jgi:hypothetical protein
MAAYEPPPKYSEFLQRMLVRARESLGEEFRGITADGNVRPGLFPVRKTGVSLDPILRAARDFLATLDSRQQRQVSFDIQSDLWRSWSNVHPFLMRHGLGLHELAPAPRQAALALVGSALSAGGFETARNVMKLNEHACELTGLVEEYSEWYYWLSIFGAPSATEPWGWQLDGHHAIVNYFVLGDQVVMTPFFAGSEPVIAPSGKYKGTSVLQDEQARGLAFVNALDDGQRAKAILSLEKTRNNNLTEAFKDNAVVTQAGIMSPDLSPAQRTQLLDLIALYVGNMDDGHARVKMSEVEKHLARTSFAWIGKTDPSSVFYYRIQNPVVLIEFDHQLPANLRQLAANPNVPNHEHIHVVVRTPNGNDYGKDLLRQHYARHDHSDL